MANWSVCEAPRSGSYWRLENNFLWDFISTSVGSTAMKVLLAANSAFFLWAEAVLGALYSQTSPVA